MLEVSDPEYVDATNVSQWSNTYMSILIANKTSVNGICAYYNVCAFFNLHNIYIMYVFSPTPVPSPPSDYAVSSP